MLDASNPKKRERDVCSAALAIYSSRLNRRFRPNPSSSWMNSIPLVVNIDLIRAAISGRTRPSTSKSLIVLCATLTLWLSCLIVQPIIARATRHCSLFIRKPSPRQLAFSNEGRTRSVGRPGRRRKGPRPKPGTRQHQKSRWMRRRPVQASSLLTARPPAASDGRAPVLSAARTACFSSVRV